MEDIFYQLGEIFKEDNNSMEYILASFPVSICDNIRISRSKIVRGEEFRGYIASKRRYFYGVRIHILSTTNGFPVELTFIPGRPQDVNVFGHLPLNLPPESSIYADSAYTDYDIEDILKEQDNINLSPVIKIN